MESVVRMRCFSDSNMQEMENLWQSRVDRKMSYLQDNCKVTEKLLWALLGEQLITYHEKQEIEVKKTDLRKLNCLIEITRFKGPDSYQKFCDALDTAGQTFVVDELTGRSTFVSARSFGTGFSSGRQHDDRSKECSYHQGGVVKFN